MIDPTTPRQTSWSTGSSMLLDLRGRAFRVVWIAADLRWRHRTIMRSLNAQAFSPDRQSCLTFGDNRLGAKQLDLELVHLPEYFFGSQSLCISSLTICKAPLESRRLTSRSQARHLAHARAEPPAKMTRHPFRRTFQPEDARSVRPLVSGLNNCVEDNSRPATSKTNAALAL